MKLLPYGSFLKAWKESFTSRGLKMVQLETLSDIIQHMEHCASKLAQNYEQNKENKKMLDKKNNDFNSKRKKNSK